MQRKNRSVYSEIVIGLKRYGDRVTAKSVIGQAEICSLSSVCGKGQYHPDRGDNGKPFL